MRILITGVFAGLILSSPCPAGSSKPVAAPRQGIKTPGIQIPFAGVVPEATIPGDDKPAYVLSPTDVPAAGPAPAAAPAGGGGRGGSGGGAGAGAGAGGGRGGGRAGGAGGGRGAGAATAFIYIPGTDKLRKIDTKTNKPVDPIASLNKPCGGMVNAFGSLWIPTCADGALHRVDPKSGKITATVSSGAADIRGNIVASPDSIWLITDTRQTLSRIDPDQNTVVGEIRIPANCSSLTFGETSLWMACPDQNRVLRINPATNVVDKRIEVAGRPIALTFGEGSVWVLCAKDGKVDRIDPKTDKVSKSIELNVPGAQGGIAFGDGNVWVTLTGFPITRIDPTAETVAQQFWGEGGGAITSTPGALWLTNPATGAVSRIDPKLLLATLAE